MEKLLDNNEKRECKKCHTRVDILIDGFCVNCYEKNPQNEKIDISEDLNEIEKDIGDLQKKYDEFDGKAPKEDMIIHGQNLKNQNPSRNIAHISKLQKKRKK